MSGYGFSEWCIARARSAGAGDGAGKASITLVTYAQGNNRSYVRLQCRFHYSCTMCNYSRTCV